MGKTLLEATVKETKKCRYPSKFYVYVLEVTWSEGTSTLIYRRYSDFFEFQCGLLERFPEEAGAKDPVDRIIPFLPGKKLLGRSQVRSVAEKRRDKLNDYCKVCQLYPQFLWETSVTCIPLLYYVCSCTYTSGTGSTSSKDIR
jgi:hypothetical protein